MKFGYDPLLNEKDDWDGLTTFFLWIRFSNPFCASVPFLLPPKTSENLWISDVFRGYRNQTLASSGLRKQCHDKTWFTILHLSRRGLKRFLMIVAALLITLTISLYRQWTKFWSQSLQEDIKFTQRKLRIAF